MALIFEDESKTIGKKQFIVPDKVVDKLKLNRNLFGNAKKSKGYKRINAIIDDDYNKRSTKKDKIHNGKKTISGSELKKLNQEKDSGQISNSPTDINNVLTGPLFPWAKDQLRAARTAVEKVKAVPPVPKLEKHPEKPEDINKPLKMGNSLVKITESTDEDWPIYYDYLTDYDAYYVLSEFFNNQQGKQDWGALINPDMYKKALSEFTKYGKLINFPSKYVYQWMGIIMKNTAILRANTDLAGHSSQFPGYEVAEYAENIDGIEIEPDYGEGSKWLEEKGLYKWMQMPDGSDAWSDYGLDPLETIFAEYDEDLPPEKVLVLVNRALDVYHQRGDMASIFIAGGSKALSKIAEEIKRNSKKIIVNENQLLALKEYHDQLSFNFDENGNAYFEKNNWEHYVDFLEDIGKPGTLPSSEWGNQEIQDAINGELKKISYDGDDLNEYDYENAFLGLVCETFIYKHNKMDEIFEDDFLEKFNGFYEFEKENNYYDRCQTIEKYLREKTDVFDDPYNLDDFLTPFGYSEYQGHLQEAFTEHFEDYDMLSSMIINDRGLIYIERNITIPNFNSPEFNLNKNLYKTYYNYLKNSFYDLGNCFSWGEDCGEAYNGSSFGQGKTSELRIKCWVDPKDINWEATVYRNCYSLNYEKEVYIDETGAKIEVFDVVLMNGNVNGQNVSGKSLIKTPIIVEY